MRRRWTGKLVFVGAGLMALAWSPGGGVLAEGPQAGGAGGGKQENGAPAKEVTLGSLVESLRSVKYHEREDATMALLRMPAERLSEIEDILARESDPEVIVRLEKVAVHLMLKGRAPLHGRVRLLGIMLKVEPWTDPVDASKSGTAVVVLGLQPGFPAAEVLESGDRIVGLEGQGFPEGFSFEDFQSLVAGREVGDLMRFTVMRNGKKLELGVRVTGVEADPAGLRDYIEQRQRMEDEYVGQLKTGVKEKAVVMKDDGPAVDESKTQYGDLEIIGGH